MIELKKRVLALLIASVLLISNAMTLVAHARASDQLDSYNITISDRGNGVVRVTATVNGTHSKMTQIGFPTIVLYEKSNGVWKAVKTISSEYAYNAGGHGYQFTYQGVIGCEYQAYASFAAKDSQGGDSRTADSNNITLK